LTACPTHFTSQKFRQLEENIALLLKRKEKDAQQIPKSATSSVTKDATQTLSKHQKKIFFFLTDCPDPLAASSYRVVRASALFLPQPW
jgi:hypothetical protein